jgi:hypothetical protein
MKFYFLLILVFASIFSVAQEEQLHRCAEHNVPLSDSEKRFIDQNNLLVKQNVNQSNLRVERVVYKIPVVVHVVYNTDIEYVSAEQVLTQMKVLNQDYRRTNSDTGLAPSVFKSIGADVEIEFVLARQDPSGKPTNGITVTKTTQTSFGYKTDLVKSKADGGADAWDPTRYLNIWVCNLSGGVLGYVPFPMAIGSKNDGVTISYRAFGTIGNLSPYFNLGRTATHEVGHWLGLYHPWGRPDSSGCTSDEVDDTPVQPNETNYKSDNCPVFPYIDNQATCNNSPNGRMFSNFMDYTRDACMNMFSVGQATRMRSFLETNRTSMLTSYALDPPFKKDLAVSELRIDTASFCNEESVIPKVIISNLGSDTVKNYKISLTFSGSTEVIISNTYLAPLKDSVFSFSAVFGINSINEMEAKVELISPFVDEYLLNNQSKIVFSCTEVLSIYPNPVLDYLKIRGNSPTITKATFYNLAGKEILVINNPYDIDVSGLQSGSYLVVFETDAQKIRQQFIVIH